MTLLLVPFVFTPARSAEQPSLLYGTLPFSPLSQLAAFSLEAKRMRVIGKIGYPVSVPLAFCPPGGVPYTITNIFDPSEAQLATLNLGTGAATLVGSPLGQDLSIMGMTCSRDGTLYAIGQLDPSNPDYNSLYVINRVSGLASPIGPTGVVDPSDASGFSVFFMALAFAPDGRLYGANVSALYQIDTATGHATKVVDFTGVTSVMGLAIDSGGNFYVCDFVSKSRIYAVDTTTGAATPILDTGLSYVHSIAFKTPG